MNELKEIAGSSGGSSKERADVDNATAITEVFEIGFTHQPSSNNSLAMAETTVEPLAVPSKSCSYDTEAMVVDNIGKAAAGDDDRMDERAAKNTPLGTISTIGEPRFDADKIEDQAVVKEQLGIFEALERAKTATFDALAVSKMLQPKMNHSDMAEVEEMETTDSKVWSLPTIVDDGYEPRLSLKQLLIMALVTTPTRTLSFEEICQWINDSFKYYKGQMFLNTLHPGTTYNWMEEVNDILHRYDFPTEPVLRVDEAGENGHVVLYLPPGREWHILPKPDKMKAKPFRFLDLPIDLRLMILELALVRPLPKKHGWIIDPKYTAKRKENFRKPHRTSQRLRGGGPHGWQLRTDPLDTVLAVLSVSKQVYSEAAPVFYWGNFLEFDSAVTLTRFLEGVPFRRKWIRNLILHYDPPIQSHSCTRAFTLLRETKLRNLQLFLDEDKLIKRHDLTRYAEPIPRLPGMKVLVELRGVVKVGMQGPCARTKKFLCKITDYKKNESKDDDELVGARRKKEQERFQSALKRSYNDVRRASQKKASETLKAKYALEKELQKRKKEKERKKKAEEVAREKKEKLEAREAKRKEREEAKAEQAKVASKVHKNDRKNIKSIQVKKDGKKRVRPADEDTSSEEEDSEEEDSEEEDSEEESSEEEEDSSPPPLKRAKTLPATSTLAAAKRNVGYNSKIPVKPAPIPRPVVTASATRVRSVTTKGGIVAKGSSAAMKKAKPASASVVKQTAPALASVAKKEPVRKSASGSLKTSAKKGRESERASVYQVD